MSLYRHRQTGTVILWGLGLTLVATVVAMLLVARLAPGTLVTLVVVLVVDALCLVLFGSLTVEVSTRTIAVWFGPGFPRKTFDVAEVRDARAVRNTWLHGWGIRLTAHGWMFNVGGLDAVELELRSGRRFRIGTDEPQKLEAAIRSVVGKPH